MTEDAFDSLVAAADPPLVVVTTASGGERAGCLVGFHGQASIDPQHYAVWLSKANRTYAVALDADHLAVHFLTADDLALAARFGARTGDDTDKFAGLEVEPGPGGVPVLLACPHRMVLERITLVDAGGDHVCLTGRAVSARTSGGFQPLRVSAATDLDPGHDADERR